jgi:hypothetical protein
MQSVSAGADSTVADSTINNKSGTEHLETGCSVPFPLPPPALLHAYAERIR